MNTTEVVTKASSAETSQYMFIILETLLEMFDRTHTGEKKHKGAKVVTKAYTSETYMFFRNCQLCGKYLTRPILEKNHKGAKVVTKASRAETSQYMFFRNCQLC